MTDNEPDDPLAVLKIGRRKHMTALVDQGLVYMNPLSFFRELEEGDPRRDVHEAASWTKPADGAVLSVQVGPDFIPMATLSAQLWDETAPLKR